MAIHGYTPNRLNRENQQSLSNVKKSSLYVEPHFPDSKLFQSPTGTPLSQIPGNHKKVTTKHFPHTMKNISDMVLKNNHTNIILMNIPPRYDLPNSPSVNMKISTLNKKLKKLVKNFPHARFLETNNKGNYSLNMDCILTNLVKNWLTTN